MEIEGVVAVALGYPWDRLEARPDSDVDPGIHSLDEYLRCRESWSTDFPASP